MSSTMLVVFRQSIPADNLMCIMNFLLLSVFTGDASFLNDFHIPHWSDGIIFVQLYIVALLRDIHNQSYPGY
jgi:uncharacterized membrane protein YkvI